ncbi:MBL fold metallo-hydrolase RNA specificity domain-containing protein [Clostridium pasteurianum]|uniref:Putative exonuclease of the beta-lactamase fold involved in RNA processing n=1 Tax=Clostridium pasteurianum BC1 TaxID=86416 RepID=R4K5H1_CLOPA|nr:MBL fold metallo-hydrolase [Clostridium pasteurianum]AGK97818.1 putative exonuclease of the beta-lactamase fold involved in RNA processing [Clostridium pasteurianum BC1]
MKLEFYGAAECVTGSCHILRVSNKTILLDCGLYQGKDEKERGNDGFNFDPKEIDYVILSHAHIDHSGRIPLLYKKGFKGQIFCTNATKDLCEAMLADSGYIQEMEVEWKNKRRRRQGLDLIEPLYTAAIARLSIYLFTGIPYNTTMEIFDGFKIRFRDSGHLLGSAFVEIFIKEEEKDEVKIVYTGDVGNVNIPIMRDPTILDYADYLIMETTYGNRLHDNLNSQLHRLTNIIKETFNRGGNVVIPSFAVGRVQEILYELSKLRKNGELGNLMVFVDSPLAAESTKIFEKYSSCFDEETKSEFDDGSNPLKFDGLIFTNSQEDSAKINKIQSGAVIISASGMCEAGRIKHHLKHNLWRKECSIVFVGYQAQGTLGYNIVNGAKKVKIFGEEFAVNASIYNIEALSGHADRDGLIQWLDSFSKKPEEIFLVHGEKEAEESFLNFTREKGYNTRIVRSGDIVHINERMRLKKINSNSNLKNQLIKLLDSIDNIDEMNKELLVGKIKDTIKKFR